MEMSTTHKLFPGLGIGWKDPAQVGEHLSARRQRRTQIINTIDNHGFNWRVWAVAATGFFTDSYNLFATNVILPSLAYVYWPEEGANHSTVINSVTLAGSIVGQLLFGFLADKFGRQKLYGIELIIVIFTTVGVTQSSNGVGGSMHIMGWLCAWRFLMGVGIGAEYPLSAVITAEWAPVLSRARMMASVFIMQPIGQLTAALVGVWVLIGLDRAYDLKHKTEHSDTDPIIDTLWRYVTGVGAIPTLIALIFRLTIPETARYTLDVRRDVNRAKEETEMQYAPIDVDLELDESQSAVHSMEEEEEDLPKPFSTQDLAQYFVNEGNWRYLAGTSICWFLLDIAFYGLGINNPRLLAKIWAYQKVEAPPGGIPSWAADSGQASGTIYDALLQNAKRSMLGVSVGSIIGSALMIKLIDYVPRKKMLTWSFLWLGVLLAATGVCFLRTFESNLYGLTIALYVLCQISFNFGANTLTFIIPAEIFPTRYRCTCHGISAAAGKLGSVVIQLIIPHVSFGGLNIVQPDSNGLGWLLIIFAVVMASGSLFSWAWIPDLQNHREGKSLKLPSKSLEELADGKPRAEAEGQVVGFRKRVGRCFRS